MNRISNYIAKTVLLLLTISFPLTCTIYAQRYLGIQVAALVGEEFVIADRNRTIRSCPSNLSVGGKAGVFYKKNLAKSFSVMVNADLGFHTLGNCHDIGYSPYSRFLRVDGYVISPSLEASFNYWPSSEGLKFIAGAGLILNSQLFVRGDYFSSSILDTTISITEVNGNLTQYYKTFYLSPKARIGVSLNQPSGNQLFFAFCSSYAITPEWKDEFGKMSHLWIGMECGIALKWGGNSPTVEVTK